MNAIFVDKTTLLAKLKENRDKHRQIFLEAQDGYRKAVIAELDGMLKDAREGRKIRRSVTLVEPMDQTSDYNRVIGMLEMSMDEKVQLEESDYQTYILDQWHWKSRFEVSNSLYSKSLRDSLPPEPAG